MSRWRPRCGPCSYHRLGTHGAAGAGCGTGGTRSSLLRSPCGSSDAWSCVSETAFAWERPWPVRLAGCAARAWPSAVEFDLGQLGPARVGFGLVVVIVTGRVEVGSADGAEAGALVAAEDRPREAQRERI